MKATGIVRNIDELGRLVIPMELRKTMEITQNTPIEIFTEGNSIILKKYGKKCEFCAEEDLSKLSDFKGKNICKSCLSEINGRY
ncbi:MAG: stage sporulation protein [Clostridiaceae bacterium]|jgi:transcriptional pleiotropic regulator of transition state genes|nr:stage sporulation protein [Clostridiaceae bacterium]